MMQLELEPTEVQQLLFVLANAEGKGITWSVTNPLLMKLGQQAQAAQHAASNPPNIGIRLDANGKEARHEPDR